MSNWVKTNIMRKTKSGVAEHGDIIDLPKLTQGVTWGSHVILPSFASLDIGSNTRKIEVDAVKVGEAKYRIDVLNKTAHMSSLTSGGRIGYDAVAQGLHYKDLAGKSATKTYTIPSCRIANISLNYANINVASNPASQTAYYKMQVKYRTTELNTGKVGDWVLVRDFYTTYGNSWYDGTWHYAQSSVNFKPFTKSIKFNSSVKLELYVHFNYGYRSTRYSRVPFFSSIWFDVKTSSETIKTNHNGHINWFASEV